MYQTWKAVFSGMPYRDLPTPTREGSHFKGWYTKQSGGSKVTSATKASLNGNQTLYAQWQTSVSAKPPKTGKWTVTVPPYYELALYSSYTTAKVSSYALETAAAQNITCTQMATLSNGTFRYYGKVNNKNVWFTYSCEMDAN